MNTLHTLTHSQHNCVHTHIHAIAYHTHIQCMYANADAIEFSCKVARGNSLDAALAVMLSRQEEKQEAALIGMRLSAFSQFARTLA